MVQDFADDEDTAAFLRSAGKNRRIRRGLIPQTKWGRIAVGAGAVVVLGAIAGALAFTSRFLMHDERFRIASSQSVEIEGNAHVTRSQMLSVFGEDIDRNIFHVPLGDRKRQLEQMPWVEHATVMRLLPNRIRVHVVERTPVAFVRQGSTIGMVDASGVLLDIPPDAPGNPNFSFPVVTGISANEPLSTRAPRMKLYEKFVQELDGGGTKISSQLSEVDLSDPEDVRALIPDHNAEVLVHFGEENFLPRYRSMQEHMAEWRQQYPRLSSVDMRYDRQVVLQMPQGATTAAAPDGASPAKTVEAKPSAAAESAKSVPAAKPVAAPKTPVPASKDAPAAAKGVAVAKPAAKHLPADKSAAKAAETAKKVAAIRAWMAQREKLRQAQKAAAPSPTPGITPVHIAPVSTAPAAAAGVQYHPSQVK
jgi:cell division protein FtsQ